MSCCAETNREGARKDAEQAFQSSQQALMSAQQNLNGAQQLAKASVNAKAQQS